ncbi:MAG: hypothetical protein L6V93_02470 [Clostridiales bacterium]|nr:MAG: hypothetical protein L6V93_02470 [Clostridiales bacterium]
MYSYASGKNKSLHKSLCFRRACRTFSRDLKISAPMAITASILVDTLQGGVGLGCLFVAGVKGRYDKICFLADYIFFSAIIGILSFSVMGFLEYILCPYKRTQKKTKRRWGKMTKTHRRGYIGFISAFVRRSYRFYVAERYFCTKILKTDEYILPYPTRIFFRL